MGRFQGNHQPVGVGCNETPPRPGGYLGCIHRITAALWGTTLQASDQEAVQRCLAGDTQAFATLVERYGGRVFNIALRITADRDAADDCAQEAFVRAHRALHQFDPSLPFGPWLYRIVTNTSLNHVQRWRGRQTPIDDVPEMAEPDESGPEDLAVRREEIAEVLTAMAELPVAYRAALTLRHIQQLSYQEVADALGLPLGTVKTHLHRARNALRVRLALREGRPIA